MKTSAIVSSESISIDDLYIWKVDESGLRIAWADDEGSGYGYKGLGKYVRAWGDDYSETLLAFKLVVN